MWCHINPFKPLNQPLDAQIGESRLWPSHLLWLYDFQMELYNCILSLHRSLFFSLSHAVTYKQTTYPAFLTPCLLCQAAS